MGKKSWPAGTLGSTRKKEFSEGVGKILNPKTESVLERWGGRHGTLHYTRRGLEKN